MMSSHVAMVTGGGRGIGRAVCLALAKAGHAVAVVSRTQTEIDEVAHAIVSGGGSAIAVAADVGDESSVRACVETIASKLGVIDILVNNAGNNKLGKFTELPANEWWQQIEVNIRGTYNCCRAVLPAMESKGWGRIVNMSSINGKQGSKFNSAYCTAKHGIIGLTRALAIDYARSGITVNAVCPGWVKTALTDETNAQRTQLFGMTLEQLEAMILKNTPQGTDIEADAVADAVAFLISDSAKRMTGQSLNVDGGRMVY